MATRYRLDLEELRAEGLLFTPVLPLALSAAIAAMVAAGSALRCAIVVHLNHVGVQVAGTSEKRLLRLFTNIRTVPGLCLQHLEVIASLRPYEPQARLHDGRFRA